MTTRLEANELYAEVMLRAGAAGQEVAVARELARTDLFFLLVHVLGRGDMDRDWVYDRCNEVQADPDGHLDLWAREHFKSSIITFGLTIQDILNDPEITVGILAYNRPLAKAFLRQIKRELEGNHKLMGLFPDVLYDNPSRDAAKWSEDDGIIVRRRGNPREATVEAWGLVDGQPVGRHFKLLVYDDIVTRESTTSPEIIAKVTEAWELSRNLSCEGGRSRYAGTRYHFNDTYRVIMERRSAIPRIYPATVDGTMQGAPAVFSREWLEERRRDMGQYTFSCQMLLNPVADDQRRFSADWLRYWTPKSWKGMNRYILVDPAGSKKRRADYTSMWVIGTSEDESYYVLDIVRDKLNLAERTQLLFDLHRKYRPLKVGYEQYSMQSDIEHIKYRQQLENYDFRIVALGGNVRKEERIERLIPLFEEGRIFLPYRCPRTDREGRPEDLVQVFVEEEYRFFPVPVHDDMLDSLARITDPDLRVKFPASAAGLDRSMQERYGTADLGPSPI